MDLNKLLKAMLVALPIMAISACSSTSESETDAMASTSGSGSELNGGVQTGGIGGMLSPEEQQRQQLEQLRKEHIIYFDFDRSEVQTEYAAVLEAHGTYLVEHPSVRVLI